MSAGSVFVDTNILVYAYDLSASDKHEIAKKEIAALWDSGQGLVSTQILQELYVTLTKKVPKPVSPDAAKLIIQDLLQWKVIINDGTSILEAIEIQKDHGFSFWDALVVQAAFKGEANILLTEDFEPGRWVDGLTIRNPFIG
jgi:predicted nucleic acid-binding protein